MNRYQKMFKKLQKDKLGAFVPFITLGDPSPMIFMNIIDTLILSGSDAIEIGIPFSDPLSDGPIIQKSIQRAFDSGVNFQNCLVILKKIRKKYPEIPIGLLIYANLIFQKGINEFYKYCSKIDIDSVLIPDLPVEESFSFFHAAKQNEISQIFICPPNATIETINTIITKSNSYIYLLSRDGITGYNKMTINTNELKNSIQTIKKHTKKISILQGFGIHTPQQAQESISLGTSGVIVGSLIAEIIENNINNENILLTQLRTLVHQMKQSMYF